MDLVKENIEQEWPLDAAGIPHRQAARVVLIDSNNETYLIHGHDYADTAHNWWFTVGGGLQGELLRDGAARELFEETGLQVDPTRLVGPVLFRKSTFKFLFETRKQDEYFFLLNITESERAHIDSGIGRALTELESEVLDGARWFAVNEISELLARGETVYPLGFAQMLQGWINGWDGKMLEIEEGDD